MNLSSYIKKYDINRNFIFFVLIVIGLCFLYNELSHNDKKDLLAKAEKEEARLMADIVTHSKKGGNITEERESLAKLKIEYKRLKDEQKALFNKFPNRVQASKMLEEVVREKRITGLEFDAYYPSEEIPTEEGYYYIPISVKVSGRFNKIGEYVKYIESLPRIFIIDDIVYTVADQQKTKNNCRATIKGRTFALKN